MSFDDDLKMEQFKMATDRQKYFTDLAKEAYNLYIKTFVYIATGTVALISLKEKFLIKPEVLKQLLNILIILITIIGVSTIGQIIFCLIRWYKFKKKEKEVTAEKNSEWWAFTFEGFYVLIIAISLSIILCNRVNLTGLIDSISK